MPALLNLPLELLTEIAKLVPQPIHLALVCRVLNGVAAPVAYHTITLPQLDTRRCMKIGTIIRTLGHLLRTVMAQPSLGMHVRHLDISFADVPLPRTKLVTKISENIRIPAIEAARSHGLDESIQQQLTEGLLGAALFLLLCHFPNLDSLDLIPEFRGDFFHHIVTSGVLPSGLRSLRSICVHHSSGIEHNDMFALFRLPSLRIIRRSICGRSFYTHDASPSDHQMVLFGGTSQIEDINIERNHVDTWVLAAMVRSVQRLRSFRYSRNDGCYDEPLFGDVLGDALQVHHAHTLENLEIEISVIGYKRHSTIGSLRGYTKLTRLAVAMPVLFGHPDSQPIAEHPCRMGELLPDSLISFHVFIDSHWEPTVCGRLTQFVEMHQKYVPNLKHLSLRAWLLELDYNGLLAACVASGITFSVLRH